MDLRKLSKYTFFTFLFFLPFQTVLLLREPMIGGEKWQYGTIGLYFSDIVLLGSIVVVVAGYFVRHREKDREWRMANGGGGGMCHPDRSGGIFWRMPEILRLANSLGMTGWSLIILLLWFGLSILWAPDQALAGYFFAKLLLGAGVFFLVRSLSERDVKTAVKVLLAAAVIQAALGIGQFLTQSAFSSSLLGMSAHESWTAGTSVLKLDEGRFLRAYGTFPHPNVLGAFLSVILVVGIGYRVFQTRIKDAGCKMQSHTSLIRSHLSCTIYHASLILILLALILTFSRAAWLGATMGIVAYCVFRIRYHVSDKKCLESGGNIISRPWNYVTEFRGVFEVLLAVGMATLVFVFVLRDQVFPRFDMANIEREGSVSERMVSLQDAKTLIAEHSLLGVGAGNFTKAVMENDPTRPVWNVQPAHNVFVLVLAELGVVGLALSVLFVFSIVRQGVIPSVVEGSPCAREDSSARGLARNDNQNQSVIFAIAFLALLPSLLLDHWLWSSHFGILFFFLLSGLAVRKNEIPLRSI